MALLDREEIKLFVTFFVIYSIFVHWVGWNENSRFDLTRAIVEEGRIEIESYHNNTGDRSYYNEHYYSDKPPGVSFLASPVYAVLYSILGSGDAKDFITEEFNKAVIQIPYFESLEVQLSKILLVVIFSSLPGALSVIILYKILGKFKVKGRLFVSILYGLSTLIFPWSSVFFGITLATFLGLLGFYLIYNSESKRNYLIAGILLGMSIVTDYLMIPLSFLLILFIKRPKFLKLYLLGLLIGASPLLIYNFSIFGNPLNLTASYMDKDVWIAPQLFSQKPVDNVLVLLQILFYPYRGLFFYHPVYIFSLLGLYFFYKSWKREAILIFLLFFSYVVINACVASWWGGTSFGLRYLLPSSPFLMIPLGVFFDKARKNKFLISIFLISVLLSTFHNLLGLQAWEGMKLTLDYKEGKYKADYIHNPLYEYYFPRTLEDGPRSRLLEGLIEGPIHLDIRDFKQMRVREVKLFALPPFGILTLKIPYISLLLVLVVILIFWSKNLRRFSFKNISLILIFLVLIFLLLLSRLEFKNLVYDTGWYPQRDMHFMSNEASIYFYSSNDKATNLKFFIGSYYKPRRVSININNFSYQFLVSSFYETHITPSINLKKGENVIKLQSLDGCDRPASLVNGSSDYRCLSFVVYDVVVTSHLPEYSIAFGKNWYPSEPHVTWAYENSTILIHSAQKARVKLNLTLASYYKPREIDFYVNNFLLDTFRVEPYKTNILTKTLPLEGGENIVEFIPKEKCDVPAIIEKSDDKRCLSFGLFDINLISPYELMDGNKMLFGPNWYEQEPDGRWMSNNASIFLFSEKEMETSLALELAGYYKERKIDLYLNKVLVLSQIVPTYRTEIIISNLKLLEGENLIEFKSREMCVVPHLIEGGEDKRCLNFKLFNLKIV
jgi:hypothetical protein